MRHVLVALVASLLLLAPARSDEVLSFGGFGLTNVSLRVPQQTTRTVLVLLPGGDGALGIRPDGTITGLRGNSLIRTQGQFLAAGLAIALTDRDVSLGDLTADLRRRGFQRVVWAGTSRGTLRIGQALPGVSGAGRPDAIVLTASFFDPLQQNVQSLFGSPSVLPPTLVIHHRQDGCRLTPPVGVNAFSEWAGSRARIVWIDGGTDAGNPCQAGGFHGFRGREGQMVSAIAGFARR